MKLDINSNLPPNLGTYCVFLTKIRNKNLHLKYLNLTFTLPLQIVHRAVGRSENPGGAHSNLVGIMCLPG